AAAMASCRAKPECGPGQVQRLVMRRTPQPGTKTSNCKFACLPSSDLFASWFMRPPRSAYVPRARRLVSQQRGALRLDLVQCQLRELPTLVIFGFSRVLEMDKHKQQRWPLDWPTLCVAFQDFCQETAIIGAVGPGSGRALTGVADEAREAKVFEFRLSAELY